MYNVLIVEDHDRLREQLGSFYEQEGYELDSVNVNSGPRMIFRVVAHGYDPSLTEISPAWNERQPIRPNRYCRTVGVRIHKATDSRCQLVQTDQILG